MPTGQPKSEKPPVPRPSVGSGALGGLRVSLMPAEVEGRRPADLGRSLVILGIVVLSAILVVGGAYFLLSQVTAGRGNEIAELRKNIVDMDAQISRQETLAAEVTTFSEQGRVAIQALEDHIYWQKFFDLLEQNTTPTVRYVNFTGDADSGQAILDAVAISYRDMAEQIVSFRENPMIESVRATSASARINEVGQVTGVSFSMTLHFKPELMRGNAKNEVSTAETAPVAVVGTPAGASGTVKDCGESVITDFSFSTDSDTGSESGSGATADAAARCFDESLKSCSPAKFASSIPGFVGYQYEIIGLTSDECRVRQSFTVNPNPDFVGKEMICPFQPMFTLQQNVQVLTANRFNGCSGPLAALMGGQ